MQDPRRTYDTDGYGKHKDSGGWGSLCPDGVTADHAQALLDTAVVCGDCAYNVDGHLAYRAQQLGLDAGTDTRSRGLACPTQLGKRSSRVAGSMAHDGARR